MLTRIQGAKDPTQLQQLQQRLDQMGAQMPADMKPALDYVRTKLQSRLTELGDTNGKKE